MNNEPLPLHFSERGEGPSVIFLHGLDSDSTVWDPVVALLAADHHCVMVDLPGHGRSPSPDDPTAYRRAAVLADLDAIAAGLEDPVYLVGHSLGGYLGMAHVLTRPGSLAGLVLVSTGPGFRDDGARERWNERVRANTPDYHVSATAATIAYHADSMVIDRISEVDVPVALVIGSGDRAFLGANDYLEKKLPNVRRTTVQGARHYVMRSDPEAVAAAVRSLTARPA